MALHISHTVAMYCSTRNGWTRAAGGRLPARLRLKWFGFEFPTRDSTVNSASVNYL